MSPKTPMPSVADLSAVFLRIPVPLVRCCYPVAIIEENIERGRESFVGRGAAYFNLATRPWVGNF